MKDDFICKNCGEKLTWPDVPICPKCKKYNIIKKPKKWRK